LLHADSIPAAELGGQPAHTLAPYLRQRLASGERDFFLLPLFFGQSRALTSYIPDTAAALRADFGDFQVRTAAPLCPLPQGEPRLVDILADNLAQCSQHKSGQESGKGSGQRSGQTERPVQHVFLVDHGSPIRPVTAVRNWLAGELARRLDPSIGLTEAAMERRSGKEYEFNGPLLAEALAAHASAHPQVKVAVAMQFLAPGRHAGPDGDLVDICRDIEQRHPGFSITLSPLLGGHPLLIEILADRLATLIASAPAAAR
jgi:hypothetical protein